MSFVNYILIKGRGGGGNQDQPNKNKMERCSNCSAEFKGMRKKCTKMKMSVHGQSMSASFCDRDVIDVVTDVYNICWKGISNTLGGQLPNLQEQDENILSYTEGSLAMALCDKCMPRLASLYKAYRSFESTSKRNSDLYRIRELDKNKFQECYKETKDSNYSTTGVEAEQAHTMECQPLEQDSVSEDKVEMKCNVDLPLSFILPEFEQQEQTEEYTDKISDDYTNSQGSREINTQVKPNVPEHQPTRQGKNIQKKTVNSIRVDNAQFELIGNINNPDSSNDFSCVPETIKVEVYSQDNIKSENDMQSESEAEESMSIVEQDAPCELEAVAETSHHIGGYTGAKNLITQALQVKETSAERTQEVLKSLSHSTWKQYNSCLKKWWIFCQQRGDAVFKPSISSVLSFLQSLEKEGYGFSSINTAQAAMSFLSLHTVGHSLGDSETIKKFRKGLHKPSVVSRKIIWDPTPVLNYLSSLEPLESLSLLDLTLKTFALISLATAHRFSTLMAIEVSTIKQLKSGITINMELQQISGSGTKPGPKLKQRYLHLPFLKKCPNICPARCLSEYLRKTQSIRIKFPNSQRKLFISCVNPYSAVSLSTLLRWQKKIIKNSGLDCSAFTPGCMKHASTKVLIDKGIPVKRIRENLKLQPNNIKLPTKYQT